MQRVSVALILCLLFFPFPQDQARFPCRDEVQENVEAFAVFVQPRGPDLGPVPLGFLGGRTAAALVFVHIVDEVRGFFGGHSVMVLDE
jgi:hypothetical protein